MIKRFVDFINWENFTRVELYVNWLGSLLGFVAFVYLLLLISGALLNGKKEFNSNTEKFVLRSFLGLSVVSLLLIVMGFLHILYAGVFFALIAAFLTFLISFQKGILLSAFNLLKRTFLENRYLIIFAFLLSLSALLPPLWTDEVHYHLVYPYQWVEKHHIFTDSGMRFPLYTFNFQILYSIGFFLHSTTFCHLLSWFCGVLGMLGIYSLATRFNIWQPLAVIGALAFILTPVIQQHLTVAYIDVPLNAYFFASIYSLVILSEKPEDFANQILAGFICAMFVGMKISNAVFAPLFLLIAWWLCRGKKWYLFFGIFSVFGVIWYARNFILCGDPIPPALNFLLGNSDKYWTKEDYLFQLSDLNKHAPWGWKTIYMLPLELLTPSANSPVRYWSVLGYVLLFPLSVFLFLKKGKKLNIVLVSTFIAFLLWLNMSFFTRYMHFLALAAFLSVILLDSLYKRYLVVLLTSKIRRIILIFIFSFILIGPTFRGISTIKSNFNKKIPLTTQEEAEFVSWNKAPYLHTVIAQLNKLGIPLGSTIYGYGTLMGKYYFFREGYRMVGDGIGEYRYKDIEAAIKKNELSNYLIIKEIDAFIIDKEYTNDTTFVQKISSNKNIIKKYSDLRYELFTNRKN